MVGAAKRALVCKQYGPANQLIIEPLPELTPGDGELLIDIHAAGINFPDLLTISGEYQVKVPPPFVPGTEAAGTVAAVGPKVKRFSVDDQVIVTPMGGAFAEQCVVSEQLTLPMPEQLSFEQAAGFTITYATSYHALRQSTQLNAGETLLVLGAGGGVGSATVEIGKALGARVIAAASTDDKLAFASELGADETINYSTESLRDRVKEITEGAGVNVVYDPVGGELAQQALRSLAWHGRYLVIGFAAGEIPKLPANIALLKEASIIGVWWGTWAQREPAVAMQNMQELGAMVASGKLKPRVTQTFALDQYAAAFAAIAERRAKGKVVLTMG